MRLMALDVGERRIGIAVSESGVFASPHSILNRASKKEDFTRLGRLVTELQIERVIVGLPYSLNEAESLGPQARRIKRYADALAETLSIPLEYFDESYSTVDAQTFLIASRRRKTGRLQKAPIDDAAAAVILQKYLDSVKEE